MDSKKTGQFIAKLRKDKGLTQKELAEKMMITDKAISRWETGKGLPDISLLKTLSEILEVSVCELLSGEIIDNNQAKEKADQVLLGALSFTVQRFKSAINIFLIIVGVFFILLPFIWVGASVYVNAIAVIGALLVLVALFLIFVNKARIRICISKKAYLIMGLLLQLGALFLEIMPWGAVMIFAVGPEERMMQTESYFSLLPFGYGHFAPLLTGFMTVVTIILLFLSLLKKMKKPKLNHATFICTVIALVFSILPLVFLGIEYMNEISYSISGLIFLSAASQAVAYRHIKQ